MVAIVLLVMTLIVLAMVLGPLLRPTRTPPQRAAFDQAVYRDQLQELDRDVARGVIEAQSAASARLELQRRLLATEKEAPPVVPGRRQPLLAAALAGAIIVLAGTVYGWLGAPGLPDDPYAARGPEIERQKQEMAQMAQIRAMVAKLAADMKEHPDDVDGWLRLGRAYAVLGQAEDSGVAFAKAEQLKPNDPGVPLAEAEALMVGHSPVDPMPDRVVALLQRVVSLDPNNPAASWYLGLHAAQQGNFAEARSDWQRLLAALPQESDERKTVEAALDAIKGR